MKYTAWWPLVLPFAVFMLLSMLEPKFGDSVVESSDDEISVGQLVDIENGGQASEGWLVDPATKYFVVYSAKILAVGVILLVFCKYYRHHFPLKLTWLAFVVGLVGSVLWIVLCQLQLERTLASQIGLPNSWFAERSGINPALHYSWAIPLIMFFAVRFAGLAIIVPIIEEMFLRGFFIRYIEDTEWWTVKYHRLGWFPLLIAPIYGVLSHPPSEALAAACWFGLITWLMVKTRNFWDCVLAHAITNLVLGIYVVSFQQWHLW